MDGSYSQAILLQEHNALIVQRMQDQARCHLMTCATDLLRDTLKKGSTMLKIGDKLTVSRIGGGCPTLLRDQDGHPYFTAEDGHPYQEFYNRFEGYQASTEKEFKRLRTVLDDSREDLDRRIVELNQRFDQLLGRSGEKPKSFLNLYEDLQASPDPQEAETKKAFWVATMPTGESYVFGPGKRAWLIGFDRAKAEQFKDILNSVVEWYREHPKDLKTP